MAVVPASLRVRLMILAILALIPLVVLSLFHARDNRRELAEKGKREALRIGRFCGSAQEQLIEGSRQLLVTLAQFPVIAQTQAYGYSPQLAQVLAQHDGYLNLGVANAEGVVISSGIPLMNEESIADRAYFKDAVETRQFAVGDYQVGRITNKPSINAALPVYNETGELVVVVFAALRLSWMHDVAVRAELPDQAAVTLLDGNFRILARYPAEPSYVGWSAGESALARAVKEGAAEGTTETVGVDGVPRLYAVTSVPKPGGAGPLRVTVGIPSDVVFAEAERTMWRELATIAGMAVLALLAVWVAAQWLVLRHIHPVVAATRRIARGDLSARSGVLRGAGEMGVLARSFDEMATSLEHRIAEQERVEGELKALNDTLEQRVAERTEELLRSNEELGQFAYVASHDLQEPLRMIASYNQLVLRRYRDRLDEKGVQFLEIALDGAVRMQRLILDLLEYSRVGTRGRPMEEVALPEVVRQAVQNLKVAVDEANATVETQEDLPVVFGDEVQLAQLFQNLVGNALKFRGEAAPVVKIRGEPKEEGMWEITVSDNGIGIAEEFQERVFVLFQRLHTRDEYSGTGIGLSVCKKIVERHGGRIWITSKAGHGTTFHFTLSAKGTPEGLPA